MKVTTEDAVDSLAARVRELEAENARLAGDRSKPPRRGSRWRAIASAACIVVAAILVPVSIVGAWARVQLVDEEAFVSTLAPLVDDPAVQQLIIDEAMTAITDTVDFDELTASVFDAVVDLGVPPRAASALELLQAPAAAGLENLVASTLTTVVESDAFSDVWATTTRAAHRALTLAATSDGGGLVVRTPDGVGIQLGAVVAQAKQTLTDRGVAAAQLIPTVDRVIILGTGENLALVRTGYALAATLGWWLPFLTLGLFGLGILFARRRSAAVLGTGVALTIGGGSLAASLSVGGTAVAIVAGDLGLSASALDVIYGRLIDGMAQTGAVIGILGVVIAVLGWVMGASRTAGSVRRTIRGVNAAGRRSLTRRGLDTGAFGVWIGRQRILVRSLIAVLAVVWLFSIRPLSFGDVLMVLVVSVAVAWILELLQRRPEDRVDVIDEAVDTESAPETTDAATITAAASGHS